MTLDTVSDFCDFFGVRVLHPLVTVANFEDYGTYPAATLKMGLYCIMYKELHCGELKYGRSSYDYQAGTLLFMAPGQQLGVNSRSEQSDTIKGFALAFHPDLLYGTPLARMMKEYSFFSYDVNEALHMSDREKRVVQTCIGELVAELDNNIDRHTKQIVASYIETLLNHCTRFYERQFVTREISNRSIMSRFQTVLDEYFDGKAQYDRGVPSVQYCASAICLSPNYFGDLVKRETGGTATEYIQHFLVDKAKILLAEGDMNVGEVAYELGFKYPHHLTRVFKKITGTTPNEYKVSL